MWKDSLLQNYKASNKFGTHFDYSHINNDGNVTKNTHV